MEQIDTYTNSKDLSGPLFENMKLSRKDEERLEMLRNKYIEVNL